MPAKRTSRTKRTRTTTRAARKADKRVRKTAATVEKAGREVTVEARKVRRSGLSSIYKKVRNIDQKDLMKTYEQTVDKANKLMKTGQEQLRLASQQVTLMIDMFRYNWNRKRELPWRSVTAITAAVMYFLGPFDILPDFIPGLGVLDDFAIIGLCFKLVQSDLREYAAETNIDLRPYGLKAAR